MKFKLLYLTIAAALSLNFFILKADHHKVKLCQVLPRNSEMTQMDNMISSSKVIVLHKKDYLRKSGRVILRR